MLTPHPLRGSAGRGARSVARAAHWLPALCLLAGSAVAARQDADPGPDFTRQIQPLLEQYCLECHGPDQQDGDLRVDERASLLDPYFITPGHAADSLFYQVLVSTDEDRMPPPDEDPAMPAPEVELIRLWIEAAAVWPESTASTPAPSADTDPFWKRLWQALGDLHPAAAHFPAALLMVGGFAALFGLRGSYRCSDFAFTCLWVGAIAALATAALGWSFAWSEGHHEDPFQWDNSAKLFWHRWTGVALAAASLLLTVYAAVARHRDPDDGTLWKLGLFALAILTAVVGASGGTLTHRRGYRQIFELVGIDPALPGLTPQADDAGPPSGPRQLEPDDEEGDESMAEPPQSSGEEGDTDDGAGQMVEPPSDEGGAGNGSDPPGG